jgi:hypothetical protein
MMDHLYRYWLLCFAVVTHPDCLTPNGNDFEGSEAIKRVLDIDMMDRPQPMFQVHALID